MYKISVIMPIYNVEEFLEEAIKSVLHQTMKSEEIEIILIDDCSTDNSGRIAEEYAQKYENIYYYKLAQNSGMAGKPRNVGIEKANGKYIMFLDPDDYYLPDTCEKMYKCIETQNVEFATSNLKDVDVAGNDLNHIHIDLEKYPSQKININNAKQALKMLKHSCPTKIIKKEFLIKNNIRFLEGVPAEDAYFTSKMFLIAKETFYQADPIICYRRRTTGNLSETNHLSVRFFERMIKANMAIYELFEQYNEKTYYQYYYVDMILYLLRKLILSNEIDEKQKSIIIVEMKDLLRYWKKTGLPLEAETDNYNILRIFECIDSENEKNSIIEEIVRLEKLMKSENINDIRKNEKKLLSEIETYII